MVHSKLAPETDEDDFESVEVKRDGRCEICYDDFDVMDDMETGLCSEERIIEIQPCRHTFCRTCLLEYIQYNISIKKIPIPCPYVGNECHEIVSERVIQDILEPRGATRDWHKFQRFQRLSQDPTLLSCPRCDELVSSPPPGLEQPQEGEDDAIPSISPDVSCESCCHTFCAIHGDSHPTMSCSEYLQTREAQQIKKSEESIRNWTKPCSHCGGFIYKHSGCDHVVCPVCDQDMCFKCGTHLYLTGKVIRRCELCQQDYLDHRYNCRYRLRLLLSLPCLLPGMILYILGAMLVAIFTGLFGCCFGCGKWIQDTRDTETEPANFAPCRGIGRGLVIVFLPILLLLNDFGLPMTCVQDLFGPAGLSSEMPVLSVNEATERNQVSE